MKTIIAIHGVGDPKPGEVIRQLSHMIGRNCLSWEADAVIVRGHEYPVLRSNIGDGFRLIEVNWSDIRRPISGVIGVIKHLGALTFGLLHVRTQREAATSAKVAMSMADKYCLVFETCGIWTLMLPAYSALLWSATSSAGKILTMAAFFLGAAVATLCYLRTVTRWWWSGFVWMLVIFGTGFLSFWQFTCLGVTPEKALIVLYCGGQFITGLLLLLSMVEFMFSKCCSHMSVLYRVSRLACLYLPFIVVALIGPLVTGVALSNIERTALDGWASMFTECLPYDLRLAEYGMAIALSFIGVLMLAGVAAYSIRLCAICHPSSWVCRHLRHTIDTWTQQYGMLSHGWIRIVLCTAPVVLLLYGAFLMGFCFTDRTYCGSQVLQIYKLSAMRIVAFIPICIGILTITLDILGDVVFYLLPARHPLSINVEVRKRFEIALDHVLSKNAQQDITIVAHSQGSVIAADVLAQSKYRSVTIHFVTFGSPIDTLYKTFLEEIIGQGLQKDRTRVMWRNCYRTGDYVGGPIKRAENVPIGCGGHMNYWSDPAVAVQLK